jgi:hypothetical protein
MKRCPQCEFIYEDDQSLCDMDGIILVFDSTPLPKLQAVTDPATSLVSVSNWKTHILPVIAAAILGTVMFLVYYVSTHPVASRGPDPTPGSTTVPKSVPQDAAGPTQPSTPPAADANSEKTVVQADSKEDPKGESGDNPNATDPKVGPAKPGVNTSSAPIVQPKVDPILPKKPAAKAKPTNTLHRSQGSVPRSRDDAQKKDSKITSFLKKTGTVLKKPFRF